MEILYILLPLALVFSSGFVAVFVWAARQGQFDDLQTPGLRVLFDDDRRKKKVVDGTEAK